MSMIDTLEQMIQKHSQASVAKQLGIAQPTLSQLMSGAREFTPEIARHLVALRPELREEVCNILLSDNRRIGSPERKRRQGRRAKS